MTKVYSKQAKTSVGSTQVNPTPAQPTPLPQIDLSNPARFSEAMGKLQNVIQQANRLRDRIHGDDNPVGSSVDSEAYPPPVYYILNKAPSDIAALAEDLSSALYGIEDVLFGD